MFRAGVHDNEVGCGLTATLSSNWGENMTQFTVSQKGDARDTSSFGAVSLESILCTEELHSRPSRQPDHEKENRALVALARTLADSPRTILQTLADTILEVSQSGSAGISLLTTDDGGKRFYWPAIAGRWKPHIGGGTPRDFGPCGDVLDRNTPLLFRHVERRYTYFQPITPPVEECLLVPFYVEGKAVGTIWAVAHDARRKFDAEDERLMSSLGKFASSAYQILVSLDALKFQMAEREKAESVVRESQNQLRTLADGLETQVRVRTREVEQRNAEVLEQSKQLRELSNRLLRSQDDERRHIARELHDEAGQMLTSLLVGLRTLEDARNLADIKAQGRRLREITAQTIDQIDRLARGLHPTVLDDHGLAVALSRYVADYAKIHNITVDLTIDELDSSDLPSPVQIGLYRILQEALTNVAKHSGAKAVSLRLARLATELEIAVSDDGCGFDAKAATVSSQRLGIRSMRERAAMLGGTVSFTSQGGGTKILLQLPLANQHFPSFVGEMNT
jgi:signal transduction histidine kinase